MKRNSFYLNIVLLCLLGILLLHGASKAQPVSLSPNPHNSSDAGTNEIVLLWNSVVTGQSRQSLLSAFPECNIIESLDNYMLISVPMHASFNNTLFRLRQFPGIIAADPNYSLEPADTPEIALSEDTVIPSFFSVAAAQNLIHGIQYYHNSITPVREVVIAVADTGIDISHPALSNFIWTNPNEIPDDGIDNDENGYIDDVNGWDFYHGDASVYHYQPSKDALSIQALPEDNDNHGTHVAGIIASVLRGGDLFQEDSKPIPVKIMPLKIHGGEKASGSVANAVKAIKYAVMMDADICNISWGSSSITSSLTTLEHAIADADLLFICAAGNTGGDNDITPVYPASLRTSNLLSVTFVDSNGALTKKSNYGAGSVDLAAPGTNVYSTIVGGYAHMSGSSMAVPYVSAIAALIYSGSEGLHPATVKENLLSRAYLLPYDNPGTSDHPETLSVTDKLLVPGIPNLYNSLLSFDTLVPDTTPPMISPYPTYSKNFIRLNVETSDEISGIRVIKYANGTKSLKAFRNGTVGTDMKSDGVPFAKPGNYTIYASDYAGNETLLHYYLPEDTSKPEFTLSVHESPSGNNYQLIADVTDADSEIVCIYIARGELEANDFPTKKSRLLTPVSNRVNTRLTAQSSYTLYARDIRGNTSTVIFTLPFPETSEQKHKEETIDE